MNTGKGEAPASPSSALAKLKHHFFRSGRTAEPVLNRWVYLGLAVLQVMFQAGIIFGWPNLELILKREGYFSDLCTSEELAADDCPDRTLALSNVYLGGSLCVYIGAPIVGMLADGIGPRFATTVGIAFTGLFYTFFSMASPSSSNLLFPAFIALGLQHNMLIFPTFSVSNLFPKHREFALSVITGTSDAGTLTFLIWEAINARGVALHTILLVHGCVFGVLAAINCLFIWPARPFPLERRHFTAVPTVADTPTPTVPNPLSEPSKETPQDMVPVPDDSYVVGAVGTGKAVTDTAEAAAPVAAAVPPSRPKKGWDTFEQLQDRKMLQQLRTPECLALLLWVGFTLLNMNYMFGSVDSQLKSFGQENGEYTTYFGIIMAAGTIGGPISGWFMGRFGFMVSAWTMCTMNLIRTVLSSIPNLPLQIPAFIMFVISRGWLFSFMTSYASATFGQFTYSRIVGIAVVVGAIFSPIQYPLISFGLAFDSFVYPNLVCVGVSVLSFVLPITMAVSRRQRRRAEKRYMELKPASTGSQPDIVQASPAVQDV